MYFSAIVISDLIEYAELHGLKLKAPALRFIDPKERRFVDYLSVVKTLNAIRAGLQDDCLGLHVGERISMKVTASVDQIMLSSHSLEEATVNAIKYSKLISDALECSYEKTEHYFSVIYEENPNWKVQQADAKRQILDLTLISNVNSFAAYTNHNYYPAYVNFVYPKPKRLNEFYRLFNCRLRFNQPRTELVYERHIVDKHRRKVATGLLESLKEIVATEIASLPIENELIYKLKKCILNNKPGKILLEEAASELNMSRRTLQRKLSEMQTTFMAVEFEIQIKLAKTYLEEAQKSIDEISYLLGFSESSAFIRFFKALTNKTPGEYQTAFLPAQR